MNALSLGIVFSVSFAFNEVTTFFPVLASNSSRATLATLPPCLATFLLSSISFIALIQNGSNDGHKCFVWFGYFDRSFYNDIERWNCFDQIDNRIGRGGGGGQVVGVTTFYSDDPS